MKYWYVYYLLLKNGDIYTGFTQDLKTRYKNHIENKVDSTKNRVKELIGYEAYKIESDARRRERFMKTTEGKRLFRQQYRDILQQKIGEVA